MAPLFLKRGVVRFGRCGLALVFALGLVVGSVPLSASGVETGNAAALALTLDKLYLTAYDEAIARHARVGRDGTTYVSTGDIEAMWLRDASAVIRPYIGLSLHDPEIAKTLRGTVARMAQYISVDSYANAFSLDYKVVERKFEVDSLLYPVWFASQYWKETGDTSIFTPQFARAADRVLATLRDEQRHDRRSKYRHPQLANNGRGSPVRYTGMVWTGFRPSDDPVRYHYNIPVNMLAAVIMRKLGDIERDVYHSSKQAQNAWGLSVDIQRGVEQFGYAEIGGFGKIYAYEVDGRGHSNMMDDANIPSLLSIPYFGYLSAKDPAYVRTRAFVLSDRNPYFYRGKYAQGIGSPHTPRNYVWPLALVMQALTSTDQAEVGRLLGWIAASDVGDHRLHESFNVDWPEAFTRADFAWPNALYAELVQTRRAATTATP